MKKFLSTLRIVIALTLSVFSSGVLPAATALAAPGNNGTLKIHEQGTPVGTESNDPKVCSFNVEGYNFDNGQTGYLQFDVQGGDGPTGTPAGPYSWGPADGSGRYDTQYFSLSAGHYKATLYGKDNQGQINLEDEKAKSKVFKVECAPTPPVDVCPNIAGDQATVPVGMVKDEQGNCVTDVCPNIAGIQVTVPVGMVKDQQGNCVTPPVDVCPNIVGDQATVPVGMVKDEQGNCVTDVCPNISGIQLTVPVGKIKDEQGNCVTPPVDVCPNIAGDQATVPVGMVKDQRGNCVTDVCPNLEGIQTEVPVGYVKVDGECGQVQGETDVCPNLEGTQSTLPAGYTQVNGDCVLPTGGQGGGQVLSETVPAEIPSTGPRELPNPLLSIVAGFFTYLFLRKRNNQKAEA